MTRARGVPVPREVRDRMSRSSMGSHAVSNYIVARQRGESLAKIASEYGVSRQAVHQALLKAKERGLMTEGVDIDPKLVWLAGHLRETIKDFKREIPLRTLADALIRLDVVSRAIDCRAAGGSDILIDEIMSGAPI